MTTSTPCSAAWRRRVAAYHDGGIVGTERNAVEAHIRACATCQELIRGYDQVYRALRAMPGFEGVLTITRPGTRRGLGSAQRPSFTYPGRSYAGPEGPHPMRTAGGGTMIITLLLVLGVIFLVGRNNGFFGPSAQPAATPQSATPLPTFAAVAPDGIICANQGATVPEPYAYVDALNSVWTVSSCNSPSKMAVLPSGNVDLGAWSPDDSAVLAFSPALPQRAATTITRLFIVGQNGSVEPVNLRLTPTSPLLSADDAVWSNTMTVLVRSGTKVLQVDLPSQSVHQLPFTATQIEWRSNELFYSTVLGGHASLHRYDPVTGINTTLLSLGVGQDICVAWRCWTNAPWDVTTDGLWVAHQYPLPTTIPTTAQGTSASLVLQSINTGARRVVCSLPISSAPIAISVSPDNRFISAINEDASQTSVQLVVGNLIGRPVLTFPQSGRLVWRPDSGAVIIAPFGSAASAHPIEIFMPNGEGTSLQPETGNYDWKV